MLNRYSHLNAEHLFQQAGTSNFYGRVQPQPDAETKTATGSGGCKILISLDVFGSPTWTRTRDLRINRALYLLSSIPTLLGVYQRVAQFLGKYSA